MHGMYIWFLATNCSSSIVQWLAVCLFINIYGAFSHLKWKLKSTDTSLASSMTDDDGLRDLQCDEEFVLSDHENSLSEPEDDWENELYETETDEGTSSGMETDTEQPRTFKR